MRLHSLPDAPQGEGDSLAPAPSGLRNLGNTCFLNAALQSVMHPLLAVYLQSRGHLLPNPQFYTEDPIQCPRAKGVTDYGTPLFRQSAPT